MIVVNQGIRHLSFENRIDRTIQILSNTCSVKKLPKERKPLKESFAWDESEVLI